MKTYNLKSVAKRGGLLAAAFALVAATFIPVASTYADALNPLTERSLTLSSSSPGWSYKDASGNSTYAQPNSGANGKQTGNTFTFRVSSSATLKGMTFQYCTQPSGDCMGPGDIGFDGSAGAYTRADNETAIPNQKSDLEVVTDATNVPKEVSSSFFTNNFNATTGQPSGSDKLPALNDSDGNFVVLTKPKAGGDWTYSPDWTLAASVKQTKGGTDGTVADGSSTGKKNYITLSNTGSGATLTGSDGQGGGGDYVKVIFFATDKNYIVNPGSSAFFVKINTYSDGAASTLVDGGVTVANVMNQSIEIQTKVLETMQFSVGTVDPNTLDSTDQSGQSGAVGTSQLKDAIPSLSTHTPCDPIAQNMLHSDKTSINVLKLGDETGEFSLGTGHTYSTHSYWRLSSNSSAGATVYYSGVTLSNTVGNQIAAIGATKKAPTVGAEQFGLALDNGKVDTGNNDAPLDANWPVSYATESTTGKAYENGADNGITGLHDVSLKADNIMPDPSTSSAGNASWHAPRLAPLVPAADYNQGTGNVNQDYAAIDTKFAFDPQSNLVPVPMASENNAVVDCVTGKVRYIANIAATTPAGIYTTKINYIASPQY